MIFRQNLLNIQNLFQEPGSLVPYVFWTFPLQTPGGAALQEVGECPCAEGLELYICEYGQIYKHNIHLILIKDPFMRQHRILLPIFKFSISIKKF